MNKLDLKFVGVVALIAMATIALVFYIAPIKGIVAPATPKVGA